MTRNVTAKGGPLHGKSYTVPDDMSSFPAMGGTYRVTAKQATWQPKVIDTEPADADHTGTEHPGTRGVVADVAGAEPA